MFQSKEEKQNQKLQKYLQKYHLEDLDEQDLEILDNISKELLGLGKIGTLLTMKVEEQAKVQHLSVLVQQNWMILRSLNKLNKNLEKLQD